MYKRGVILWIIVVALLTGCVGKSNKHASDVTPTVGGVTSAADVKTTQTIFWQLAIIGGPSLEEAEEINRLLREKGYDFEIQFVRTGAYVPEMNRSWLEDYENNNQPFDILNGGIWNDIYDRQSFLLDYFEPITDYLISEEGTPIKELFSEYEWGCVSCKGDIFSIPALLSVDSPDSCTCLLVPDRNLAYFADFDGSYASLKAIFEENHRSEEHIIVSDLYALPALIGYQTYYSRIPYDAVNHKLVDCSDSKRTADFVNELIPDIENHVLELGDCYSVSDNNTFAIIKGSRIHKAGYTVVPLQESAGDVAKSALSYGISKKSSQKELALSALRVCYTDPDISVLLLPEVNGLKGIQSRKSLTENLSFGELQGFIPNLSEEQWRTFLAYPYRDIFTTLFVRELDEKTGLEKDVFNEQYNLQDKLDSLEKEDYSAIIEEVNRQIEAYLSKEE